MTRQGIDVALNAARQAHANDPALQAPIGTFFGVDIEARLADESLLDALVRGLLRQGDRA